MPGIGARAALGLRNPYARPRSLAREPAATLDPLAPVDEASGKRKGSRHIAGGRDRVRKSLYAAALPAALQGNPALAALYGRLKPAGNPRKLARAAGAGSAAFANTRAGTRLRMAQKNPQSTQAYWLLRASKGAETAATLFWALLASGQIAMRKVDSWRSLAERPSDQIIDLAA